MYKQFDGENETTRDVAEAKLRRVCRWGGIVKFIWDNKEVESFSSNEILKVNRIIIISAPPVGGKATLHYIHN